MFSRKSLATGFAALTLGLTALGAASPASAGWKPWKPYPKYYGGYYGGYMAAGLAGGMALGALAASSSYGADCYIVRRKVATPYGLLIKKVRVCE